MLFLSFPPPLPDDKKEKMDGAAQCSSVLVDVVIIGGGISGLSAATLLAKVVRPTIIIITII